jgi:exodeoxyribonuclease VII small subunit
MTSAPHGRDTQATTDSSSSLLDDESLDYAAAVEELDAILVELEDEALNVDILADRVKRASQLITFCRSRITSAKTQVEQIVTDLEQLGETE